MVRFSDGYDFERASHGRELLVVFLRRGLFAISVKKEKGLLTVILCPFSPFYFLFKSRSWGFHYCSASDDAESCGGLSRTT